LVEALLDLCAKLSGGDALVGGDSPSDLLGYDDDRDIQVISALTDVICNRVNLA